MRYLYLLVLLLLSISTNAQNGLTKIKLYPNIESYPRGFHILENQLLFSTNDATGTGGDLWMTDGDTYKKVGKGRDGNPFPQHYIAGANADSVFILSVGNNQIGYANGLYSYNLKTDSFRVLHQETNISISAHYKDDNHFYYSTSSQGKFRLHRYTISLGKSEEMIAMQSDSNISGIYPAHGRIYVVYSNSNSSAGTRAHLHVLDTVNKKLSPPVLPGSVGTYTLPVLNINGDIYFFARGPQYNAGDPTQLYKYTGSGTPQQITSGIDYVKSYDEAIAYNNYIYVSAVYKYQINESFYRIDINSGVYKLIYKNNNPGYYDQFWPKHFYVHNKRLFMSGLDETLAHQPYVYDGLDTPKRLDVLQIKKYATAPNVPKQYTSYKGYLYFAATDSNYNVELWRFNDSMLRPVPPLSIEVRSDYLENITAYPNPTDGDAQLDITLKTPQAFSVLLTNINGQVVYKREAELYSSGKHTLTIPMSELPTATYIYSVIDKDGIMLNSGRLIKKKSYFSTNNHSMKYLYLLVLLFYNANAGAQISYKLFNINVADSVGSHPANFTVFKDLVYFYATDTAHGRELMASDGDSVWLVNDMLPGTGWGAPMYSVDKYKHMDTSGQWLYFCSRDSIMYDSVLKMHHARISIYRYDGINQPQRLYSITHVSDIFTNFTQVAGMGGKFYYFEHGKGINVYDPSTNLSTLANTDSMNLYPYSSLIPLNNKLYCAGGGKYLNRDVGYYDPSANETRTIPNTSQQSRINYWAKTTDRFYYLNGNTDEIYGYDKDSLITIISVFNNIVGSYTPFHQGVLFAIHNDDVYYSALNNGKRVLYMYRPSTRTHWYKRDLPNDTIATGLVSYRNKLFYYNPPETFVDDFNGPPQKLQTLINNPKINFCEHSRFIIHKDKLFASVHVGKDTNNVHEHELLVLYDSTLSINTVKKETISATAYPNPTNGDAQLDITLKTPQAFSVLLTNINGQVVYKREAELYSSGKHTLTIPMSELPTATYIYSVVDKDGIMLNSGKLLKQ